MRYFIPIGADCTVARILKQKNFRVLAFPFDWIVCPLKSIYLLLSNNFKSFMENIVILESENRMLFDENDKSMTLIVSNQKIHPVIDVTYDILFPHDFFSNDENTIIDVKNKYKNRIDRLLNILNNKNNEIIFVYCDLSLNEWQKSKFNHCNINVEYKYNSCQTETIKSDICSLYSNCKIIHINHINHYNL
jgi:hypothetical protein